MFMTEWTVGEGAGFAPVRALREEAAAERGAAPAEFDGMDAFAAHLYVCTDGGAPIAAGRMYPCPERDAVRMDRLVVAAPFRGKMYDDLALRVMLYKAQQMPFAAIEALVSPEEQPLFSGFGFAPAGAERGGRILMRMPREAVVWDSVCKRMAAEARASE